MAESRRRFDQDFKEGEVGLAHETGHPIAQIAKDLGINPGTLADWSALDRQAKDGNGSRQLLALSGGVPITGGRSRLPG